MKTNLPIQFSLVLAGVLVLLCSCNTVTQKVANCNTLFQAGQYNAAAEVLVPLPNDQSKALLPNLHRASSHLMSADFSSCLDDLGAADEGLAIQDRSFNFGFEYLGRTYDGFMLNTYQALIYWIQGKTDQARVCFNRLDVLQGRAANRNLRAITNEQNASRRLQEENPEACQYLDMALAQLSDYQRLLGRWEGYENYQMPVGCLLSGLFRLFYTELDSDATMAVAQLGKAFGMTNSEAARRLWTLAEQRASGRLPAEALDDCVFVLFENGLGPVKEERRYELVIPMSMGPLYVGVALPMLVERAAPYPYLEVRENGNVIGITEMFCSIDRLVATEFRSEMKAVIAGNVTCTIIKAVAQVLAEEYVCKKYGKFASWCVGIVGSLASRYTTKADRRNWDLLPKEYQVAIIPRPQTGRLELTVPGMNTPITVVELPSGPSLVYVKIPLAGKPALVEVTGPKKLNVSRMFEI